MNYTDSNLPFSAPPFKVEYRNENAVSLMSQHLSQRLCYKKKGQDIVILCIGTDRSTGDALGPIVGSQLHSSFPKHFYVYGTLEEPVHAINLKEKIDFVAEQHHDPIVIAIDACLGQFNNVGSINVADGPLKPGAGVKKELPSVGTFHITGIVNVGGFMEYFVLQNTRLFVVMKMAEIISNSICHSVSQFQTNTLVNNSYFTFSSKLS